MRRISVSTSTLVSCVVLVLAVFFSSQSIAQETGIVIQDDAATMQMGGSLDVNLFRSGPRSLTCNSNFTLLGALNVTGTGRFAGSLQTNSLSTGTVSASTASVGSIAATGSVTAPSVTAAGVVSGAQLKHSHYFIARSSHASRPVTAPGQLDLRFDVLQATGGRITSNIAGSVFTLGVRGLYHITANVILSTPALPDDGIFLFLYQYQNPAPSNQKSCFVKVMGKYGVLSCMFNSVADLTQISIFLYQESASGCYAYTDGGSPTFTCITQPAAYAKTVITLPDQPMELAIVLMTAY